MQHQRCQHGCVYVQTRRVPEAFGQYSQAHDVSLGDGPLHGQELNLMSLVDVFQFG